MGRHCSPPPPPPLTLCSTRFHPALPYHLLPPFHPILLFHPLLPLPALLSCFHYFLLPFFMTTTVWHCHKSPLSLALTSPLPPLMGSLSALPQISRQVRWVTFSTMNWRRHCLPATMHEVGEREDRQPQHATVGPISAVAKEASNALKREIAVVFPRLSVFRR